MPELVFLGCSNAVPAPGFEHTHLACVGEQRLLLIDCVNNPVHSLHRAGLDANRVSDLLLTHFHPDHVAGVPSFLLQTWLLGRTLPLHIYGLEETLQRVLANLRLYEWETWPGMYPVAWHPLPSQERFPVFQAGDFAVHSSPMEHLLPTLGVRLESREAKTAIVYSCDTQPCQSLMRLAQGAQILIHEATGEYPGHTSASQAGKIAQTLGVQSLYLIHYPTRKVELSQLVREAQDVFQGEVHLAQELSRITF